MNREYIFYAGLICCVIAGLLLSACASAPVCNKPYILKGTSCCIDKDSNAICDNDETAEKQVQAASPATPGCAAPYMTKGNDCCLDKNQNKICDSDEAQQTPSSDNTPSTKGQERDTNELFNQVKESVVLINVTTRQGDSDEESTVSSGFFISSDGYIMTNLHSIVPFLSCEIGCSFTAMTYDKKIRPIDWIAFDADWDFALLKLNKTGNANISVPVLLIAADSGKIGDPVYIVGAPMGNEFSISKGIISQKDRPSYLNESQKYKKYLQTDAAVNYGSSGGPFLNSKGEVTAMATYGYEKWIAEGMNYGLQAEQLNSLLSQVDKSTIKLRTGNIESAHSWTANVTINEPVYYSAYIDEPNGEFVFENAEFKIRNDGNYTISVCPKMKLVSYAGMIHLEKELDAKYDIPGKTGKFFKLNETITVAYPEPHFFIIDMRDCTDKTLSYGDSYAYAYET